MSRSPFQEWLNIQEHERSGIVFLVEWMALFGAAWFFWSVMFFAAPGSAPPGPVAALVSILYATCLLYGRVLRVTGCPKCRSPLPFVRREVGRRRLPDREQCIEVQYGAEEWGQVMVQVYARLCRTDIVTYRCGRCEQRWEQKIEQPSSGYRLVRRDDPRK